MSHAVFVIVGKNNPLYEAEFGVKKDEHKHMSQFVLHAALDLVDEKVWSTGSKYLKVVDRFANLYISVCVAWSRALHAAARQEGRGQHQVVLQRRLRALPARATQSVLHTQLANQIASL